MSSISQHYEHNTKGGKEKKWINTLNILKLKRAFQGLNYERLMGFIH